MIQFLHINQKDLTMGYIYEDINTGELLPLDSYHENTLKYINQQIVNLPLLDKVKVLKSFLEQEKEHLKEIEKTYDHLQDEDAKEQREYWNEYHLICSKTIYSIQKKYNLFHQDSKKNFQLDIMQIVLLSTYLFIYEFKDVTQTNQSIILSNITGYGKDNILKAIKSLNKLREGRRKPTLKDVNNHRIILELLKPKEFDEIKKTIRNDLKDIE